jgi:hypothetical protein
MTVDRKNRHAVGIDQIDGKRNPPLQVTLPLDYADKDHPVLPSRKIWRIQLVEYTVNIELAVGSYSCICAKEEYRFHRFAPPPGIGVRPEAGSLTCGN